MSDEEKKDRKIGLVVRVDAHACLVDLEDRQVRCLLRGKLFESKGTSTKPVVVGDRVVVDVQADGEGALSEVLPRSTKLSRSAADKDGVEHVVVANVDTLIIVSAVKDPPVRTRLIDRFLVAGWRGGLLPIICFNKVDLCAEDEPLLVSAERTYEKLGIRVIRTSATDGRGIEEFRELLAGKISVLAGSSGVGKSSLLNRAVPGFELRTKHVGRKSRRGRHTTTAVSLYKVPGMGHIVDTPGIRGFGIWDVSREDLGAFFPEVVELAEQCRFRGCSHTHEPRCAVKLAVEEGTFSKERYESYCRILDSLAS